MSTTVPTSKTQTRLDWLRLAVHAVGLFGLVQLAIAWLTDSLTVNPIQFIEQALGQAAINMLTLSLAVTPTVTLTGWNALTKHRRTLGLYAFFYFLLHVLVFAVVDYGLDWEEIWRLTAEKPFIFVGVVAGSLLTALAFTSFKYWMKRLGKGWQQLHRLAYVAAGLAVVHYAWAVKGSLSNLSGDITRPLVMGLILTVLLLFRFPPIRRWASTLKRARPAA